MDDFSLAMESKRQDILERIKKARADKGYSQNDVAAKLGVADFTVVSNFERGATELTLDRLIRLSHIYGVPLGWIVDGGAISINEEEKLKLIYSVNILRQKINQLAKQLYEYSI